jgi:serine/threonine-protein kinase
VSKARGKQRTTREQPAQPGDLKGATLFVPLTLTRWIGAGGMGEVWEARSADLPGMRLAVKVVALEHAHDPHAVARFFGEARAAAAIDDPNILSIHGTGRTEDGRPALVMQYIEGSSLAALCDERGPLPIDTAGQILLQIASALRAAHRRNITHRDIKGHNVMVIPNRWGREWFVILVDFGIAKFHDADLAREIHTHTTSYLGTPGYSAPEQIVGKPVDAKADIYALGVVAYRSVCGRPPYLAAHGMEVMNLQLNGAPFPEPRELRPDLPRAWNEVILAALSRDPALRPTAPEFARRIADGMCNGAALLTALAPRIATEAASTGGGRTVTPWSHGPIPPAPFARRIQGRRARLSTAAALVTGACLGAASTGAAFKLVARQARSASAELPATVASAVAATNGPMHVSPAVPPTDAGPADAPSLDPPVGSTLIATVRPGVTPEARASTDVREPGSGSDAARPARATGALTLRAEPWADCYLVDGERSVSLGTTPVETRLSVGPHRVRFVNEDRHRDETVTVIVDAAKPSLVERNW